MYIILLVWLYKGKLSKLIVVIKSRDSGDILERWQFNIDSQQQEGEEGQRLDYDRELTDDTKAQIRAIMRQILASVTVLPELDADDGKYNNAVFIIKRKTTSY